MNDLIKDSELEEEIDKFLLYRLNGESYATPLKKVREIVEPLKVKAIPHAKNYFLGVINLRGQIIGLIDLSKRFAIDALEDNPESALIVFDTDVGPLAAKVDKIESVVTIMEEEINRNPNVPSNIPQNYLIGIARKNEDLISLVDLNKVLTEDDLIEVQNNISKKAS